LSQYGSINIGRHNEKEEKKRKGKSYGVILNLFR